MPLIILLDGKINSRSYNVFGRKYSSPVLVVPDDRYDYGEDRRIGIGMLEGGIVVVIFTEHCDDTIRIISMMKALSHERIRYEQHLRNQLGYD